MDREAVLKRLLDVCLALGALVLVFPVLAAIAVAIKLDSPGSVLYCPVRTGRFGVPFRIYKFRTMIPGADTLGGGTTALHDPRITRVGKLLRRFKLDELPQLFNIIAGEMSFVGPRPELPRYTALYSDAERRILHVLPGLTDYSSLEFFALDERVGSERADEIYETDVLPLKNQLRLRYAEDHSFLGDLKLIARTIGKISARVVRCARPQESRESR